MRSYLSGRTYTVRLGDTEPSSRGMLCGVPQGSVLELRSAPIYPVHSDLGVIADRHGVKSHFYADDSQLYVSAITRSLRCCTPSSSCHFADRRPLCSTGCDRPDRYDAIQSWAVPQVANLTRNRLSKTSWYVQSNATLRSSGPSIIQRVDT